MTLQHHHHPHFPAAAAAASEDIILLHPKSSSRRPLQPINSLRSGFDTDTMTTVKRNANRKPIKPSLTVELDKENENWWHPHHGDNAKAAAAAAAAAVVLSVEEMEKSLHTVTLSLEEELMVARKKMERMRIERKRTERLLDERSAALDAKMREVVERGEVQKALEMEVDRLYRLKQLKSSFASKVMPMRSLREMEQSRKSEAGSEAVAQGMKLEGKEKEEESGAGDVTITMESPRSSVASAESITAEE